MYKAPPQYCPITGENHFVELEKYRQDRIRKLKNQNGFSMRGLILSDKGCMV